MVVRLIGNVDGVPIVFYPTVIEGLWKTTVPLDLDGTYVLDLMAEDEAGNIGYYATALFTVDSAKLKISVVFLKYRLKRNCCKKTARRKKEEFVAEKKTKKSYGVKNANFFYSIKCETYKQILRKEETMEMKKIENYIIKNVSKTNFLEKRNAFSLSKMGGSYELQR